MDIENPFFPGRPAADPEQGSASGAGTGEGTVNFTYGSNGAFSAEELISRTAKEQYENLINRQTTFIFFFGKPAAGKSHLMASLIHYMKTCELGDLILSGNNLRDAHLLFQDMFKSIQTGTYLNRTAAQIGGTEPPTEIDLIFRPKDTSLPEMRFTFLEMSGENLELVQVRGTNEQTGRLPDSIETYLNCPDLQLNFFLLSSHESATHDSQLIDSFLDYLVQKDEKFDRYKYLLAITKWDTYKGEFKNDYEAFIEKIMPHIYHRLIKPGSPNALTSYSLGVFQKHWDKGHETDLLVQADYSRAAVVTAWMYKNITGRSLIPEPGFLERIRLFFGI